MIPEYVMLHHSLTTDGPTVSWGAIRYYHTVIKGWRDVGYHYGIELISSGHHQYYEILQGRMPDQVGAHCYQGGMNRKSIGVCLVGNFDEDPVPQGQMDRTIELVSWLLGEFHIPVENILGHRDFASYKSCPGSQFDLDAFRNNF